MSSENQTVRDIMMPLVAFPCMKESGTVQEAIQQIAPVPERGVAHLLEFFLGRELTQAPPFEHKQRVLLRQAVGEEHGKLLLEAHGLHRLDCAPQIDH